MSAHTTEPIELTPTFDCRKVFAEELLALARNDRRIVAVCNDSVGSSNLVGFRDELPDQLVNVGIAEQDLIGTAAGLANAGMVPFVCAAAPFLTGRALEQIKADIAYSGHAAVLCGMSPGMAYGELGPTHHSIEDLSWLRAIADIDVVVPAGPEQTRQAVQWAARADHPVFLRIGRHKVPEVTTPDTPFIRGAMNELAPGTDATIVATGTMVSRALGASAELAEAGIGIRVLEAAFIEPLDEDAIARAARETGRIVTAEEATLTGGLGAAVATVTAREHPVPVRMLGVPRQFAPTGSTEYLLEHFHLTTADLVRIVRSLLHNDR